MEGPLSLKSTRLDSNPSQTQTKQKSIFFFHPSKTSFIAKMWRLFANASYSKKLVEINKKNMVWNG